MFCVGDGVKDHVYLSGLYDVYSDLLTEKQKQYFVDYYFENFSLQEISENHDVSRSAVHKQLKEATDKLCELEKKLAFFRKREKILMKITDEELKKVIIDIFEEE